MLQQCAQSTGNKKRFILMHLVADRLGENMAVVVIQTAFSVELANNDG